MLVLIIKFNYCCEKILNNIAQQQSFILGPVSLPQI